MLQRAGLLSSCGAWVFHCGSLSCAARALGHSGFGSRSSGAPAHRLNSCGAYTWSLCGMWDLPRLGIEPVSPALAGRFFTTESPGKHCSSFIMSFEPRVYSL